MVFEFTDAEKQELMDIDKHYADQLDKIDAKIRQEREGTDDYNNLVVEHIELEDARENDFSALYDQFEKVRFDQLGGDPAAILANGKEQTELILKNEYEGRKQYDIDLSGKPKSADPKIESSDAVTLIRRGISLHFDALKGTSEGKELRDYVYNYVSISPYTYTNTEKKKTELTEPPEKSVAGTYERLTKLPSMRKYGYMRDKANKTMVSTMPVVKEIDGQLTLRWGANQARPDQPPVPVLIALRNHDPNIKTSQRIDAKDEAILTAISNIVYDLKVIQGLPGPYYITPQEIWRRMNGITDGITRPPEKQLADICERMEKMRHTDLYMDITHEIEAGFISPTDDRVKDGIIDDYYLPAARAYATTEKGRVAAAYKIYDIPFIYEYNLMKGHVLLVDYDLLNITDTTRIDGYTVEIRNYLLLEIGKMYEGLRDSNRILYNTMYKEIAMPTPKERADAKPHATQNAYNTTIKKESKVDREKVADILQSWKNKKWILDFTPTKKGRTYSGVEIKLNPEKFTKPQLQNKKK